MVVSFGRIGSKVPDLDQTLECPEPALREAEKLYEHSAPQFEPGAGQSDVGTKADWPCRTNQRQSTFESKSTKLLWKI